MFVQNIFGLAMYSLSYRQNDLFKISKYYDKIWGEINNSDL